MTTAETYSLLSLAGLKWSSGRAEVDEGSVRGRCADTVLAETDPWSIIGAGDAVRSGERDRLASRMTRGGGEGECRIIMGTVVVCTRVTLGARNEALSGETDRDMGTGEDDD